MAFVVVGLNHKTAPVEIREQAFIPAAAIGECVQRLIDRDLIESGVLLSTCNRTELYAIAAAGDADQRLIQAFGLWPHQLAFDSWQRFAFRAAGSDAVRHLFRVAAGLESMVIGEGQVLGQLKDALALGRAAGATDARLEIVVRGAIRAGKRVRSETALGREPVSVSHAAVVKAAEILGDLRHRGVLILGAGRMSAIAVRLLRNRHVGQISIASRTIEHAERTARTVDAGAMAIESLEEAADGFDLIMSSSSAPHYLLDAARVEAIQSRRNHRPLLIIDMAVPRDIDPAVAGIAGVRLLDIDDLLTAADHGRRRRAEWVPAAERIIEAERRQVERALEARDAASAIAALVDHAGRLRDEALESHLSRIPAADVRGRAVMRDLARALTARLLHESIQALRRPDDAVEITLTREALDPDGNPS